MTSQTHLIALHGNNALLSEVDANVTTARMTPRFGLGRAVLVVLSLLLAAMTGCKSSDSDKQASSQKASPDSGGFVAEVDRAGMSITLDFSHPPDFLLTMKNPEDKDPLVCSTRGATKGKSDIYEFVKKESTRGGNKCVMYSYKEAGKDHSNCNLFIWTNIESVSPDNLDYMKIDRVPFCIVQMVTAAGISPIPLNKKDAPQQEKFQANGPIPFQKNGKWGYMDPSGTRVVIEPQYDDAQIFSYGRALVHVGANSGYIDTDGRWIFKSTLGFSKPFGTLGEPDLAEVSKDDKHGVINRDGKIVVKLKYDSLDVAFYDGVIKVSSGGKEGFVRKDGKVLFEPRFAEAYPFREGLAAVQTEKGWGFVDTDGSFAIEPVYENAHSFCEGLAGVRLKSGKWGCIDGKGKMVVEPKFDYIEPFSEGLAAAGNGVEQFQHGISGGTWGYIDKTGKVVIDLKYSSAGQFEKWSSGGATGRSTRPREQGWEVH